MKYYYTFTGKKVRTEVLTTATGNVFVNEKTIEYVNGLAFKGGTLEFIPTAEGRALSAKYVWSNAPNSTAVALTPPVAPANQYRYEYQLKDHLGDLRVSCRCGDPKRNTSGDMIAGLEPTMAVQENHYDPWGLGFADVASNTQKPPKNTDRFQYNGKEKVSDLGLGLYDYGARHYDPTMGRFISVDPLAENYFDLGSYAYVANNPLTHIDPNGKEIIIYYKDADGFDQPYVYEYGKGYNTKKDDKNFNQYVSDVVSSLNYIVSNGADKVKDANGKEFSPIERLAKDKDIKLGVQFAGENIDEFHASEGKDKTDSDYINYDPNSASENKEDGSTQTPALGLYHEIGHAYSFFKSMKDNNGNRNAALRQKEENMNKYKGKYKNESEFLNVTIFEIPAAIKLREGVRRCYPCNEPFQTDSPVSRKRLNK